MENRSSITSTQFALMTGGNAIIVAYTFIPLANTNIVGINIVYTLLLSIAYILVMNIPILILMIKFRNATVNQIAEIITGKVVGKIIAALLALFFLFNFTVLLSISLYYIKSYLLPSTPIWAMALLTMTIVLYTALKGSGALARMATVIIPLLLLTVVIFFVAGLDKIQWADISILTGCSNFAEMNKYAFFSASRYTEMLMMNIFCRNLMKKSSIGKTYVAAFLIFLLGVIFIVMPMFLTLGAPLAKLQLNPYFIYSRQVGQHGIFQKLQGVNIYFWYLGILYKLSIYIYMASSLITGIFEKFNIKPITWIISGVMLIVSNIGVLYNIAVVSSVAKSVYFPIIVTVAVFGIPLVLLIISFIRHKHVNSEIEKVNVEIETEGKESDFTLPEGEEIPAIDSKL